jgi:hypothetical protein
MEGRRITDQGSPTAEIKEGRRTGQCNGATHELRRGRRREGRNDGLRCGRRIVAFHGFGNEKILSSGHPTSKKIFPPFGKKKK